MLPEFTFSYFENLSLLGRSPSTIKRYQSDLGKFLSWLPTVKEANDLTAITNLTAVDYKYYIEYLENVRLSDASIKRLVTVLINFLVFFNITPPPVLKNATKIRSLRPLIQLDFIEDSEFEILQRSISTKVNSDETAARDFLIDRNVVIIYLMRFYGLTPTDIHKINMHDINFAQNTLVVASKNKKRTLAIDSQHMKGIVKYYNSIPELFRPHYKSLHPLFVSFFNVTMSYYYDYAEQRPKRLSVRAIQEMVKDEVCRAGLRKLSSVALRNSAILTHLENYSEAEVVTRFGFSDVFSIRRYKEYLGSIQH